MLNKDNSMEWQKKFSLKKKNHWRQKLGTRRGQEAFAGSEMGGE